MYPNLREVPDRANLNEDQSLELLYLLIMNFTVSPGLSDLAVPLELLRRLSVAMILAT
jgi:hypothetical protein